MAEVINLRQGRKAKTRSEKEKTAEQNRQLHGQTKAVKQKKKLEDKIDKKRLDGHKRDKDEE